jgi:glyoxylase-like metal-dependent hydrolase (beta-lactamase superfamily II)
MMLRSMAAVLMTSLLLMAGLGFPRPAIAEDERNIDEVKERGWDFKNNKVKLEEVVPGVWRATGVANAYIIQTSEGAVVVDTGSGYQAREVMALLEGAIKGPISKIILTHCHTDHAGGAKLWMQKYPDAEVIAHEEFPRLQEELELVLPYHGRRATQILPGLVALSSAARDADPLFEYGGVFPDILVDDDDPLVLEMGDTEIHVLGMPGGEGADGLGIWLPKQRLLFTGDLTGPHFPMFPNLYSIRGERYREFLDYIRSVDKAIALEPAVIAHGHFDVIRDADYIRRALTRMRDAVQYVHDEVVAGMNADKTLPQLMREIKLPAELELSEGYGKVAFSVRGLWETYNGWFQMESPTELYPVPVGSVYSDLVEAAGGPQKILEIATRKLADGELEKALHLVEVAEAATSQKAGIAPLKRRILVALRERAVRETNNFMEVSYLDARIAELSGKN